jgi:hypothetical protein
MTRVNSNLTMWQDDDAALVQRRYSDSLKKTQICGDDDEDRNSSSCIYSTVTLEPFDSVLFLSARVTLKRVNDSIPSSSAFSFA